MSCKKHCWHVTSSFTAGFYGGSDACICCHCGTTELHHFRMIDDPKHGPYGRSQIRQYEEEDKP
jgi:hypothetical protein